MRWDENWFNDLEVWFNVTEFLMWQPYQYDQRFGYWSLNCLVSVLRWACSTAFSPILPLRPHTLSVAHWHSADSSCVGTEALCVELLSALSSVASCLSHKRSEEVWGGRRGQGPLIDWARGPRAGRGPKAGSSASWSCLFLWQFVLN